MAATYRDEDRRDRALTLAMQALELDERHHILKGVAEDHFLIGQLMIFLGANKESLEHHEKAIFLSRKLGNQKTLARAMVNQVIATYRDTRSSQLFSNLEESYKIFKDIGDIEGMGANRNTLANMCLYLGDYQKARTALKQLGTIARKLGNSRALIFAKSALGNFYIGSGKPKKALKLFKEGMKLADDSQDLKNQQWTNLNVGSAYLEMSKPKLALPFLQTALRYAEEQDDPEKLVGNLLGLADAHGLLKNYSEADKSLKRAFVVAEEKFLVRSKLEIFKRAIAFAKARKNYKKALELVRGLSAAKNDELRYETEIQLRQLKSVFGTRKNQWDIEQRSLKNKQLQEQNDQVRNQSKSLQAIHAKLKKTVDEISTLKRMIPICANCKKIRDDFGYWEEIETFLSKHSELQFTPSFCPECSHK